MALRPPGPPRRGTPRPPPPRRPGARPRAPPPPRPRRARRRGGARPRPPRPPPRPPPPGAGAPAPAPPPPQRGPHRLRVTALGEPDLQVLRLAGRAGGRGAEVGDLRVRGEAGREGHRELGAAQRPLDRASEVAVRGEAQPAALGVADAQPLD